MAKIGPQTEGPNTIYQSVVMWLPSFAAVMTANHDAFTALRDEDELLWNFHFKVHKRDGKAVTTQIPFNANGPRVVLGDQLLRWGTIHMGPGVWVLSESIHVEGYYHGFVVLRGVPEPAPWLPKYQSISK